MTAPVDTASVDVAIVGSGPAGLSAGARAARRGLSHIVLERTDHLADTLFRFQKGKLVLSTPDALPLRADVPFSAARREAILGAWAKEAAALGVRVRFGAEVAAITRGDGREDGRFLLTLASGERIRARNVVLAIGLQGNVNRLGVPGADLPHVQYQLDDPDAYVGETIVVVGAGDAAIENAVALTPHNKVVLVNRSTEFARLKKRNLELVEAAIARKEIECLYGAKPVEVGPRSVTLQTDHGTAVIDCDRVLARIGASPPRRFVEACGVRFPSDDRNALPDVSSTYETNVPGLYVIGALGGYPLIKQALNQGYEVVEFIAGNAIPPADEPLLKAKFATLGDVDVTATVERIRATAPIFAELNPLVLRELLLDSQVHAVAPGAVIFRRNDYSNSFFTILSGSVDVQIDPTDPKRVATLGAGEYFGEMGLISGRRRSATVVAREAAVLIETDRRAMLKLRASTASVRAVLDHTAAIRAIGMYLAPGLPREKMERLAERSEIREYAPGDVLFRQGEPGDSLHLIRTGSVTVSQFIGGRDIVTSYVPAGDYVGEMALLAEAPRSATITAATRTETIRIDGPAFQEMIAGEPELRRRLDARIGDRIVQNERMADAPEAGSLIEFLVGQGLGEATDVLLIDESLCIRCDNCEKACAATHEGVSRLDREAGPSFATIHVPTSCRHCEHPHCMSDCPPNAIHRNPNGEVFITDACIGCGQCEANCPYGVIQMAIAEQAPRPWWRSGIFAIGRAAPEPIERKKAVKCDMCKDLAGGAACVRACPTGAARRAGPEEFMSLVSLLQRR